MATLRHEAECSLHLTWPTVCVQVAATLMFLYRVSFQCRDLVGRDAERCRLFQPILGSVRFRMRTHMLAVLPKHKWHMLCRSMEGDITVWHCWCQLCGALRENCDSCRNTPCAKYCPSVRHIIAYFMCCLFAQTISVCLLHLHLHTAPSTQYSRPCN